MDEDCNKKTHVNKYNFTKMHEKVQNKYNEMQQKLERSRSMDALHISMESGYPNLNGLNSKQNVSELQIDQKYDRAHSTSAMQDIMIKEELHSENSNVDHLVSEEYHRHFNEIHDDDISVFSFNNASLESLSDNFGDSNVSPTLPKPPPRARLRDKIAAVRERRRRKDEEKKEKEKEKQKETKRRNSSGKLEKLVLSNSAKNEFVKSSKKIRSATLTIALIEAKGMDFGNSDDKVGLVYCKFRLGTEKYKSKLIKCDSSKVNWLELFNLNMYEEFMLEITLWNKEKQDNFLGRKVIDITEMEKEKTSQLHIELESENNKIELFMLLTISGTNYLNTVVDLNDYVITQDTMISMQKKFAWYHLADDYSDVGFLSILIYGAKGLSANDTYCVFEIGNSRVQTHTEYKTCDPNWMKVFNFNVTDITSILEVSIYEESKKFDSIVVAKVSIPLLRIKSGEKKWYALKDKTQRERAKGNFPRILLEMRVTWHPVRASVRVINPKEVKYLEVEAKLDRRVFARNLTRSKAVVYWILDVLKLVKTCFEWESKKWSSIAIVIWLLACWFFEPWMLPILLLTPFIWYRPLEYRFKGEDYLQQSVDIIESNMGLDSKQEKEEKKSLRERITSLQEMTQTVQNAIGKVASIGESLKNLVNFTVPFLSFLAIFILLTVTLIMYFIPVKYIFMAWGINKYTRKIRRPNRIPNNEVLDLLSRVPDDETLLDCEELPLDEVEDVD